MYRRTTQLVYRALVAHDGRHGAGVVFLQAQVGLRGILSTTCHVSDCVIVDGAADVVFAGDSADLAEPLTGRRSRTLANETVLHRRQGTMLTRDLWQSLFPHACQIILDCLMLLEVFLERVLAQI